MKVRASLDLGLFEVIFAPRYETTLPECCRALYELRSEATENERRTYTTYSTHVLAMIQYTYRQGISRQDTVSGIRRIRYMGEKEESACMIEEVFINYTRAVTGARLVRNHHRLPAQAPLKTEARNSNALCAFGIISAFTAILFVPVGTVMISAVEQLSHSSTPSINVPHANTFPIGLEACASISRCFASTSCRLSNPVNIASTV